MFFDQWACVTRYVWAYEPRLYLGPFNAFGNTVDYNGYAFITRPWLPRAHLAYMDLFDATARAEPWKQLVFWQPSPSLYLLLAGLLTTLVRQRRVSPLLVFQGALINTAGWLLLSPNPDLRFLFPTLLAAPLAWAWAVAPRVREARERSDEVGAAGVANVTAQGDAEAPVARPSAGMS
ncbi:hypothetical protein D7V97_36180 [Corallococcus sp. CA053C]|uniref:hypothetical protein n=1 Tax=Corallococcus sp. CA053C TaxID=2316732 RepID=UPI000EA21511|nr:hypothetical protein [Corallococcus sp. CA053C]RKG96040.1 hypothetical protein D7V97_36180 [Corallococcus sp. CA053C]